MDIEDRLCHFYIVRHGQTEWNVAGRVQGHSDSPLTNQGISQARNLGKKLSGIKFDLVFSSDLLRAKRTAEIIALEQNLAVKTTQALRERSWGRFEGLKNEQLHKAYDLLTGAEKIEAEKKHEFEPDEDAIGRMITFLRETAVVYPRKTVLVVTHGGIMSRFLTHIGLWENGARPHDAVSNGAIAIIESDGVDFFIKETEGIVR